MSTEAVPVSLSLLCCGLSRSPALPPSDRISAGPRRPSGGSACLRLSQDRVSPVSCVRTSSTCVDYSGTLAVVALSPALCEPWVSAAQFLMRLRIDRQGQPGHEEPRTPTLWSEGGLVAWASGVPVSECWSCVGSWNTRWSVLRPQGTRGICGRVEGTCPRPRGLRPAFSKHPLLENSPLQIFTAA